MVQVMKIMETSCNTQCTQPCSRLQPTHPSARDSWTLRASLGQSLVKGNQVTRDTVSLGVSEKNAEAHGG